jgi:Lrp/AsnC family transcriptional regulator for asnA, asnC and gidA
MKIIDNLDREILRNLLEDGRKSFVEIAESCGASKEVVKKRYNVMVKKGIIIGATTQIDFRFFGFNFIGHVSLSVEQKNVEKIRSYLRKNENVKEIFISYDYYNLMFVIKLSSVQEIDRIKEELRKQAPITAIKANLWTEIRTTPENILSPPKQVETQIQEPPWKKEEIQIDEIDSKLIDKLSTEGRCPFSKIAEEMGTSVDTIIRRYEKLRNNKIIKVVIQINPLKIDYNIFASFALSQETTGSIAEIISKLNSIQGIFHVSKCSGEFDLVVMACIKDCSEFFLIRDQIAKIPSIRMLNAEINHGPAIFPSYRQQLSTF